MDGGRIGERVAALRKVRGFTQRQLADRAHLSYSLLTKVESGHAPATPAVIGALARALRVDVPRITGQPYEPPSRGRSARLLDTVEAVRRALASFDYPSEDTAPRTAADLATDVQQLSRHGQRADYVAIGLMLPTLLDELSVALHAAPDADRPRLNSLLAEAHSGVSALANILGYLDLRDRAVDRIEAAARQCDEPLRVPRVQWQRGQSLMAVGAYAAGLELMRRTRAAMGGDLACMSPRELSVYGSLHLRSAVLAARAAKTEGEARAREAQEHVAAAREVATVLGRDRDDYGLAFGPSNVTQHAVSVAVELEDGAEAVRLGRATQLGAGVPAVRRGHHFIDLSRGYLMEGNRPGALRCLQRARRAAPQQTRHHPMVRETVLAIAESGRGSEELSGFANWLGID